MNLFQIGSKLIGGTNAILDASLPHEGVDKALLANEAFSDQHVKVLLKEAVDNINHFLMKKAISILEATKEEIALQVFGTLLKDSLVLAEAKQLAAERHKGKSVQLGPLTAKAEKLLDSMINNRQLNDLSIEGDNTSEDFIDSVLSAVNQENVTPSAKRQLANSIIDAIEAALATGANIIASPFKQLDLLTDMNDDDMKEEL